MSASKSAHMAMMRKARALKREQRMSVFDTFERLYRQYRNERLEYVAAMAYDGGTGRPPVPRERGDETAIVGGMTISASAHRSVRDSFDARPAKSRSSERPYSNVHMVKDVEHGSAPIPHRTIIGHDGSAWSFECVSIAADGSRTAFTPARAERPSKGTRGRKVTATRSDVDRALMSAMGTIHSDAA